MVLNRGLQYSEPQEIVQPARYVSGIAISGASSGISDKMQGVNHRARFAQIFKKAKEAGISLAEDGLERAIEYIDKHHDEIFNYATTLVKKAIENAKEMKDTSSD